MYRHKQLKSAYFCKNNPPIVRTFCLYHTVNARKILTGMKYVLLNEQLLWSGLLR